MAKAVSEHLSSPAWFCQKRIRKRSRRLLGQQKREANHLWQTSGGLPGVGARRGKTCLSTLAGPLFILAQDWKDAKNTKGGKHPGKGWRGPDELQPALFVPPNRYLVVLFANWLLVCVLPKNVPSRENYRPVNSCVILGMGQAPLAWVKITIFVNKLCVCERKGFIIIMIGYSQRCVKRTGLRLKLLS